MTYKKNILILTGKGRNGKTTLAKLIHNWSTGSVTEARIIELDIEDIKKIKKEIESENDCGMSTIIIGEENKIINLPIGIKRRSIAFSIDKILL